MDQLSFGQSALPGSELTSTPGPVTKFPGPGNRQYHPETLLAYLTNIERLAARVKTIEDWQMISVDLLDNCQAAQQLLKCMV